MKKFFLGIWITSLASISHGACFTANLAGHWELFHDINERWYSCTMQVAANGIPIENKGRCKGRAVDDGLVGDIITGGRLRLDSQCILRGEFEIGGVTLPIIHSRMQLDRNRAYGYMFFDPALNEENQSPFEMIRY